MLDLEEIKAKIGHIKSCSQYCAATPIALVAEVERLRGLLAEVVAELDEAERQPLTVGLQARIREAMR